jgi:hypothetical protein
LSASSMTQQSDLKGGMHPKAVEKLILGG